MTTATKAATSGGAVAGQLEFGWLADMIDRRKMHGVELTIILLATLAWPLSAPRSYSTSPCVFSTVLTSWKHFCRRFCLGSVLGLLIGWIEVELRHSDCYSGSPW